MKITTKGYWVVNRMKELDPEAFDDRCILDVPRPIQERRANAFKKALQEWENRNDPHLA